jgi:hypothetical protein
MIFPTPGLQVLQCTFSCWVYTACPPPELTSHGFPALLALHPLFVSKLRPAQLRLARCSGCTATNQDAHPQPTFASKLGLLVPILGDLRAILANTFRQLYAKCVSRRVLAQNWHPRMVQN